MRGRDSSDEVKITYFISDNNRKDYVKKSAKPQIIYHCNKILNHPHCHFSTKGRKLNARIYLRI